MNIPSKKTKKTRKTLYILLTVIVLAGGLTAYATAHMWPFTDTSAPQPDYNTTSKNPGPQASSTNNQSNQHPTNSNKSPDNKTPQQYDTPPSKTTPSSLTGVINYNEVNNGTLSLRVTIDQKLNSGTCTLTLTHKATGTTYRVTADIVTNPSSASCKGFDVPTSKLKKGIWNISISLNSGSKVGKITGETLI